MDTKDIVLPCCENKSGKTEKVTSNVLVLGKHAFLVLDGLQVEMGCIRRESVNNHGAKPSMNIGSIDCNQLTDDVDSVGWRGER